MKKKKTSILWKFFCLLLLAFIVLYIALESGYYETKMSKKTAMTNESIKKFEMDVKEGKQIDFKFSARDYRNCKSYWAKTETANSHYIRR